MNQIIEMIPIEEFVPTKKGLAKHLVKTKAVYNQFFNTLMVSSHYLEAQVGLSETGKITVDVSNQTVTHISKEPLYGNGNDSRG
jgi:hypothetical protein